MSSNVMTVDPQDLPWLISSRWVKYRWITGAGVDILLQCLRKLCGYSWNLLGNPKFQYMLTPDSMKIASSRLVHIWVPPHSTFRGWPRMEVQDQPHDNLISHQSICLLTKLGFFSSICFFLCQQYSGQLFCNINKWMLNTQLISVIHRCEHARPRSHCCYPWQNE